MWILFDERYLTNPDEAVVYCIETTYDEAYRMKKEFFPKAVIVGMESFKRRYDFNKTFRPH